MYIPVELRSVAARQREAEGLDSPTQKERVRALLEDPSDALQQRWAKRGAASVQEPPLADGERAEEPRRIWSPEVRSLLAEALQRSWESTMFDLQSDPESLDRNGAATRVRQVDGLVELPPALEHGSHGLDRMKVLSLHLDGADFGIEPGAAPPAPLGAGRSIARLSLLGEDGKPLERSVELASGLAALSADLERRAFLRLREEPVDRPSGQGRDREQSLRRYREERMGRIRQANALWQQAERAALSAWALAPEPLRQEWASPAAQHFAWRRRVDDLLDASPAPDARRSALGNAARVLQRNLERFRGLPLRYLSDDPSRDVATLREEAARAADDLRGEQGRGTTSGDRAHGGSRAARQGAASSLGSSDAPAGTEGRGLGRDLGAPVASDRATRRAVQQDERRRRESVRATHAKRFWLAWARLLHLPHAADVRTSWTDLVPGGWRVEQRRERIDAARRSYWTGELLGWEGEEPAFPQRDDAAVAENLDWTAAPAAEDPRDGAVPEDLASAPFTKEQVPDGAEVVEVEVDGRRMRVHVGAVTASASASPAPDQARPPSDDTMETTRGMPAVATEPEAPARPPHPAGTAAADPVSSARRATVGPEVDEAAHDRGAARAAEGSAPSTTAVRRVVVDDDAAMSSSVAAEPSSESPSDEPPAASAASSASERTAAATAPAPATGGAEAPSRAPFAMPRVRPSAETSQDVGAPSSASPDRPRPPAPPSSALVLASAVREPSAAGTRVDAGSERRWSGIFQQGAQGSTAREIVVIATVDGAPLRMDLSDTVMGPRPADSDAAAVWDHDAARLAAWAQSLARTAHPDGGPSTADVRSVGGRIEVQALPGAQLDDESSIGLRLGRADVTFLTGIASRYGRLLAEHGCDQFTDQLEASRRAYFRVIDDRQEIPMGNASVHALRARWDIRAELGQERGDGTRMVTMSTLEGLVHGRRLTVLPTRQRSADDILRAAEAARRAAARAPLAPEEARLRRQRMKSVGTAARAKAPARAFRAGAKAYMAFAPQEPMSLRGGWNGWMVMSEPRHRRGEGEGNRPNYQRTGPPFSERRPSSYWEADPQQFEEGVAAARNARSAQEAFEYSMNAGYRSDGAPRDRSGDRHDWHETVIERLSDAKERKRDRRNAARNVRAPGAGSDLGR